MSETGRIVIDGGPGDFRASLAQLLGDRGWDVRSGDDADELDGLVIVVPAPPRTTDEETLDGLASAIRSLSGALARSRRRLIAAAPASIVIVSPPLGSERESGLVQASGLQKAVAGIVRGLAVELGDQGTRVNAILPGVLRDERDAPPGVIPLLPPEGTDRRGTVLDIAHAIDFLLSPDSAYITGIELPVDGGLQQCRSSGTFALWDAGLMTANDPPQPFTG